MEYHQPELQKLLEQIYDADEAPGKILIFCETKRSVDAIAHFINGFGERCGAIHGDKSQTDRDNVLRNFRSGRTNVLVATDVAARGLDVDGIKHVINYDYPQTSEDYIHRIGRTGRRDTKGTSHTFLTDENARQAADLVGVLREAKQTVDAGLEELAQKRGGGGGASANRRYGGGGGGYGGGYRNNQQNYRRNSYGGGSSGGYNNANRHRNFDGPDERGESRSKRSFDFD